MSFEKMVETYSRTSRTQNSDPSLFLFSKPNTVLEFCIDTNINTTTHIKIQTQIYCFSLNHTQVCVTRTLNDKPLN